MNPRKKKIRTIFLFTSVLLFFITSSALSAAFNLPLQKGWNLISLPLVPKDSSIQEVLFPIQGSFTEAWMYNSSDEKDKWKHYFPNLTQFSDLTETNPISGYWINSITAVDLALEGPIPNQNYTLNLKEGWNLFGWPYLYPAYIKDVLNTLAYGLDYDQVSTIDPISKEQLDYFDNPFYDKINQFSPGRAYYIHSLKDIDVTIPCIPQVKILSPLAGARLSIDIITVKGEVDDSNSSVSVNGFPAAISNGEFTSEIPLQVGANLIKAEAINQAGNTSDDSIIVMLSENTASLTITSYPKTVYPGTVAPLTLSWNNIPLDQNYKLRVQFENWFSSPSVCIFKDIDTFTSSGAQTFDLNLPDTLRNTQNCRFVAAFISKTTDWRNVYKFAATPYDVSILAPTISIDNYSKEVRANFTTTLDLSWDRIPLDKGYILRVELQNYPSIKVYTDITDFALKESRAIILPIPYTTKGAYDCNFTAGFIAPGGSLNTANISFKTASDVRLIPFLNPSFYIREADKTNNPNINLCLYAEGAREMMISTYYGFYGCVWEPYLQNKPYTLLGTDGLRRLYVKFRDPDLKETDSLYADITLDTSIPQVAITSPQNSALITQAPITVTGTINDPTATVYINGVPAAITGNTFTAENIDLNKGQNTILAKAIDPFGNIGTSQITVTSTSSSNINLTKLTDDIEYGSADAPVAGSQLNLKVKLEIDGQPALNEPIQFTITSGKGTLSQTLINTNSLGEAQTLLTTDTNSNIVNTVEAFAQNYPTQKITFTFYTKAGEATKLIKITDDSVKIVPGAIIDMSCKLTDSNNNPIPDQMILFNAISGTGSLANSQTTTTQYGEAKVSFTTPQIVNSASQIEAKLSTNPTVKVIFTITTSQTSPLTVEQVMAKVQANDSLIQDIKADIYVESNAPWSEPVMELKIWEKGDKQKVQEISPNPKTLIRPPLQESQTYVGMTNEILSFDPRTNIYKIRSKLEGQAEEYPYEISFVDYTRGIVITSEYYIKDCNMQTISVSEPSDFTQINEIWVYQTLIEITYERDFNKELYRTTNTYSNIQINTGISDSEFQ